MSSLLSNFLLSLILLSVITRISLLLLPCRPPLFFNPPCAGAGGRGEKHLPPADLPVCRSGNPLPPSSLCARFYRPFLDPAISCDSGAVAVAAVDSCGREKCHVLPAVFGCAIDSIRAEETKKGGCFDHIPCKFGTRGNGFRI
jgi:hypothetical protein